MYSRNATLVRGLLAGQSGLAATELQRAAGLSQPTVSRALAELGSEVVRLGQGRSTRYWLATPLFGLAATQPVRWVQEDGGVIEWGVVHRLEGDRLALQADGSTWLEATQLPWPLAPLRRQGFLGRLAAELTSLRAVLGTDVEQWSPAGQLFAAAIEGADLPGALVVGNPPASPPPDARLPARKRAALYETIAGDVTRQVALGSSAGGEQPKFTAVTATARVIVKFSPPRNAPFGARWNDLLRAEATALAVLAQAGEPVATARIVEGPTRTFLESDRFDRVGATGRRHVVALDAIHDAFVKSSRQHWAETCEQLVAQGRLSPEDLGRVRRWRAFGRLIANTDMHFGNLSFFVRDFAAGHFSLAPCYDMLPMQYRPGVHQEDLGPTPFTPPTPGPDELAVWPEAASLAKRFWSRAARDAACSEGWRAVCLENARRLG